MTNKTQCPNCLTVYFITDEQYQRSKGRVRCGTCRQPFAASFLADNEPTKVDSPESSPPVLPQSTRPQASPTEDNRDPIPGSDSSPRSAPDAAWVKGDPSSEPQDQNNIPGNQNLSSSTPDLERAQEDQVTTESGTSSIETAQELNQEDTLDNDSRTPGDNPTPSAQKTTEPDTPDLIEQVDALLGEKIFYQPDLIPSLDNEEIENLEQSFAAEQRRETSRDDEDSGQLESFEENLESDQSEPLLLDEPFYLDGKRPRSRFYRWLVQPAFGLIGFSIFALLVVALVYQLWLRQAVPILENEALADKVFPYIEPVKAELAEQLDFQLPVRRDLANLRLISARIEPHPTRSSTTLLKVSVLNRSKIAQPFPSMELALTDEGGRLVSRRSLSPEDYLHNNRLENRIRPNELRQIAIELLTFPKQAHGYELKLLDERS